VKALGLIALVVLILVGALMPLKYTARLNLPAKGKDPSDGTRDAIRDGGENDRPG
jgi:hypothetical protein